MEKVRFPLAQMTKAQVFERAREYGLAAAEREESQDFVPPEYFELLFSDKPSIPGDIIDLDGHVLGKHRGIEHDSQTRCECQSTFPELEQAGRA